MQQFKVGINQNFKVIIKLIVLKVLFSSAANFNQDIYYTDIKKVYFYRFINQPVYIDILESFETEVTQKMICKLRKALHCVKQFYQL